MSGRASRARPGRGAEKDHTVRRTDRLDAFSDAVLAIAITLPVITLQNVSPEGGGSLGSHYLRAWPEYVAYGVSFLVVGLYWVHAHFGSKIIVETDHGYNLLTLLFLGLVSFIPIPARGFAHYAGDPNNQRVAAVVLTLALMAPSLVWLVRWLYAVRRKLPDPRLSTHYVQRVTRQHVLAAAAYGVAALLCILGAWRIGVVVSGCTVINYLRPPTQPEYRPGQEPRDELEEADELPQEDESRRE